MQEHDPPRTLVFHPSARSVVYFGPFRLDLSDGLLSRDGEEVRLPPRALTILQHLVERAGRIVSKQSLMDVAWKDAHVSETSLTEAVGLIRQALGDDPQKPEFIQTVHRRGYRFIAPIATDAPSSTPQDGSQPPEDSSGANDVAGAAASSTRRRGGRRSPASLRGGRCSTARRRCWVWMARRPSAARAVRFASTSPSLRNRRRFPASTHTRSSRSRLTDSASSTWAARRTSARLFLREMNRFDAVPLPGTEGAHGPFFSPDGDWVAFFAQGSLKKVRVTGDHRAAPQVLCATETGVGGAWVSANEIVFAPNWRGPLMRVAASGGQPAVAVTLPAGTTLSMARPARRSDHPRHQVAVVGRRCGGGGHLAVVRRGARDCGAGDVRPLRIRRLRAVPARRRSVRGSGGPVRASPAGHASPRGSLRDDRERPARRSSRSRRADRFSI